MPPTFVSTIYNNDKAFLDKYMTETPGYYTTGDAGYFD
jgi:propionyl-CoA synthetase